MKTILFGVIGAVSVYVFGALKIPGPSAMFFVLSFAVSTSIPASNLQAVFLHAGLVFLGGTLSWCISMSGWLINPRGPETAAVAKAYRQLASFVGSLGTESFHAEQHKTVVELRAAETAMKQAKINRKIIVCASSVFIKSKSRRAVYLCDGRCERF
ncbi:FUSC family membrane protein [Priestia megaterium]